MRSSRKVTKSTSDFVVIDRADEFPIIPSPDTVLFPDNSLPLSDLSGLKAADRRNAAKGVLKFGVVSCSTANDESLEFANVGTEAQIVNSIKLPNGKVGAVVSGGRRFLVESVTKKRFGYVARVAFVEDRPSRRTAQLLATTKTLRSSLSKLFKSNDGINDDTRQILMTAEDPTLLCNLVVPYLTLSQEEKLSILGTFSLRERLRRINTALQRELELHKLSVRIHEDLRGDLYEMHRREYLKEQIRALKQELGEMDGEGTESDQLESDLEKLPLDEKTRQVVDEELERMVAMGPSSPDYFVSYNYLSLIAELPWSDKAPSTPKLKSARSSLDRGHYGMERVKERVLEYLAVMIHRKKSTSAGRILLLNGPPGVGKTSLAKGIAEALRRPFVKVSLGGVKDEAEIRGHRRTYIAAMPGKIIQGIKQSASRHPVMLLDEIDKAAPGGVTSALLEVLDPEQNANFVDHFLSVPFDLSGVIFVATSNNIDRVPSELLDRFEVVELPSYADAEKEEIAQRYLIPNLRKSLGLKAFEFRVTPAILSRMIEDYTREAGVRQLKRELERIGRKIVLRRLERNEHNSSAMPAKLTPSNLKEWLGPPRFLDRENLTEMPSGVATGLAYTDIGGEVLLVEVALSPSPNGIKIVQTGSLGKVMQESADAALTFLQCNWSMLKSGKEEMPSCKIHLHLPDGATPKDGPSAGVGIFAAMVSAFLDKPLPADLAMTGEVTLRGQVTAVGGIREKILAAVRHGKSRVLIPKQNIADLEDVPEQILNKIEVVAVESMQDVLNYLAVVKTEGPVAALEGMPVTPRGSRDAPAPGNVTEACLNNTLR